MSKTLCPKSIRPLVVMLIMIQPFLTPPARAAETDMPADARVMRPQKLFDPGIGKDAYSVLVPDQWKMQGQVWWTPGLPTPYFDLSVADPEHHVAWRQFPRLIYVDGVLENWLAAFPDRRAEGQRRFAEGTLTSDGLENRKLPASPREYVEKILAPKLCLEFANAKDVTLVFEKDLPEMARAITNSDPTRRPARSCRFRVAYTAPDGPVEREFVVTLIVQHFTPHPGAAPSVLWIGEAATCRAPKGKLDALMPIFTAIGSSVAPLPDWYNIMIQTAEAFVHQVQQADEQIIKDQRDAMNARMKILTAAARQANADTSDRIRQRFDDQQNAKAQVQRQFMHYVTDTSSFRNPHDGSTVTLKANYRYQYVNNFGEIIQTNDPTFKPPVDPKTTWRQMDKMD